jgi:TIR domain
MAHPAAFEYDLFLSHNSADKDWTRFLAQAIEADATGPALRVFLDVWYIEPGDNIVLALERALKASRRVGLVLSPKAIASDWVNSERSTAIYRDPASHKRTIIPLLHKDCEIPDLLRPLAFIDFRDPRTFGQSLSRLLWVLRGQKPVLGSKVSEEELLYREDCEAIRDYRNIFERPAFQTPCFQELCLEELSRAIRDTLAALNTGTLASRDGVVLRTLQARSGFHTQIFFETLAVVAEQVSDIRRTLKYFEQYAESSDAHPDFYTLMLSTRDTPRLGSFLKLMDQIDTQRNEMLAKVNLLLAYAVEKQFNAIRLSSSILAVTNHPRDVPMAIKLGIRKSRSPAEKPILVEGKWLAVGVGSSKQGPVES